MSSEESSLKRISVFCSTSLGGKPEYGRAAHDLGMALAGRDISMVYGGGKDGLAGVLVRAFLEAGGKAVGVMPRLLVEKGKAFEGLEEFLIARDLHDHKAKMAEMGEGFIALPGGLGTLEEFFEALTWAQLGIHHKPCGLLNVRGYYDKLLSFMDDVRDDRFIDQATRELILVADQPDALLDQMNEFAYKR